MALNANEALDMLTRLYDALKSRRPVVALNDDYYRGKHPLHFASPEWAQFHGRRYQGFSDNWCAVVANSPNERLRVDGIRLDDSPQESEAEKLLWSDWQRNDGDAQSSQGFLQSIIAERSFVLVWAGEDEQPVMTWEHPSQVIVGFDPERPRVRRAALKAWQEDNIEYATLYTPDEVWKFQRSAFHVNVPGSVTESGLFVPPSALEFVSRGGWQPRQPADDDTWPIRNPLGVVPVVEFPNRPTLGGGPVSDIAGTRAMQDAINLLWAYLFNAADYASMPARVVMGQDRPKVPVLDSNGQQVGEREVELPDLAQGRFLWLTGQNTKIGQWDPAKLDVFTSVVEIAVGHIAAQTRTPPHYLVTNKGLANLSGDALVAAETGLVKKAEEQQLFFGPEVREVFRLFALVRGDGALAELVRTAKVNWRNPAMRSEAQLADANLKRRQIGYPFAYILEMEGHSPTEIARILRLREEEQDAALLAAVQDAFTGAEPQQSPAAPEDTNPVA